MPTMERIRERVTGAPGPEYWKQKADAGWKLVAIEWARESGEGEAGPVREDVPFGLRVADDCFHLEENPPEKQVLVVMMDLIARDSPLSVVARELNERGFRTRQGMEWGPAAVFELLPRLVEAGPRIFASPEWGARSGRAG